MNQQNNLDQLTLFSSPTLEEAGIPNPIKKKEARNKKTKKPKLKVLKKNIKLLGSDLAEPRKIENFLVDDSNQEAFFLAQEIIKKPGINFPFVIFQGESGSGKTFLLESIFEEWENSFPESHFIFLNGKDISQNNLPNLIKDFSKIDGIIIDDFLMGQNSPQFVSLFPVLFDNFANKSKPIIISLDSSLNHLQGHMEVKFNNRINSALNKEIGTPTKELLVRFCNQQLMKESIELDEKSQKTIEQIPWKSFFQVKSFLQKLKWHQHFNNRKINHLILLKLAGELNSENSFSFYLNQLANHFNLPPEVILSTSRKKELVYPRQILMYYLHTNLKKGVMEIGSYFKRDHTTILYGIKKIKLALSEGKHIPFKQIFYNP